ncbi:MAG: ATP-binding protein [Verrucomicrobia bacterium]|jgi:heavy metal sensor kinase|nr:ATP-binding protein [Verrucomicrobiota bacterium]
MNLNSFRFKIALLSGLITGLLLVGSGFVLWRVSYQFNLDRLDREIRNVGQANLDRVQGGDHWARLEEALKFVAGNREAAPFVLWVKHNDKVIYQSPDWPTGLAPESFSVSEKYDGQNAPKPGQPFPPPPRRGEPISPSNPALPLKSPRFSTVATDGKSWRAGVMGNPYVTLILAANMDDFDSRMTGLRNTYLSTLVVVLVLVAGGAWFVARRALRPVTALTRTAERVTAHGLDQRIPAMTSDAEFNRLITVFNEMLDRLEKSFTQATRFSADASHELKTPLARLQVELEQALGSAPSGSPQQEVYSSLLDEVSRLKAIVQKLLLLSLADAGRLQLKCKPVNLTRMLENVIEDCRAQAPHLTVEQKLAPDVHVNSDADLLEQALQNLASNAIKYNYDHGRIRFELATEANHIAVRVANSGPGIPPADRERIFERFYRADKSRSGRVDGVGLGLSLSREIIRTHGGELSLEDSEDGFTCFAAKLPTRVKPASKDLP